MIENLSSQQALIVPYRVPAFGAVVVKVRAVEPVSTLVLDEGAKVAYESGDPFIPLASHRLDILHSLLIQRQQPGSLIYLIVENPSDSPSVQVEYEVGEPLVAVQPVATGSYVR